MRQTLLKWGSQSTNWLYILLAYPIIDYVLRKFLPIPVISSFWDEGLLLLLLVFTFFAYLKGNRTLPSIKHPFAAFIIYGVGLMVIDMVNVDASIEGFRSIYEYMVAFFIGFYLIQSSDQLEKLVKVMAAVGFVVGFIGIMQVVLRVETPASWVQAGESTGTRAFSIVTSPNVLGSYMAFIVPVVIGLIFSSKNRKERLIWLAVALVTLGALVFTSSRGAWFAFAFVLYVGCYIWNKRIAGYLFLAGVLGVVVLYFIPDLPVIGSIKNRIGTLFTAEYIESSLNGGRLGRWFEAYNKMRLDPLFGVGMGHHGGAVAYRHFGTIYSDSYLFKSIAEIGLIGVGLLISLVTITIRYGLKLATQVTGSRHFFLVLGLACGLFAVALHNMVENIFEVPFMSLYFWLFGGFLCGLLIDKSQEKQPWQKREKGEAHASDI